MKLESDLERIAQFNSHLEECKQCELHPFDLCPKGAALLKYAATGIKDDRLDEDRVSN